MASMRKKGKSGYYYARFYDPNRSPKQKTVALKTTRKDVARRRLASLEERYEKGAFDPWTPEDEGPKHLSVGEAIDAFLDDKRGKVRESTVTTYSDILGPWARDYCPAGLLLKSVEEKHLRPFIFHPKTENATKRKRFRHLRSFFNHSVMAGRLKESPLTDALKPRKEEKQPAFLTPDEMERLLLCIEGYEEMRRGQPGPQPDYQWLKDSIQIAICCGLRRGELARLHWTDVDLEAGRLYVRNSDEGATKGGDERTVPIVGPARDVLHRRYLERTGGQTHVITDTDGKPPKLDRYSKSFKRFVRRAKLRDRERLHFPLAQAFLRRVAGLERRLSKVHPANPGARLTAHHGGLQPPDAGRYRKRNEARLWRALMPARMFRAGAARFLFGGGLLLFVGNGPAHSLNIP